MREARASMAAAAAVAALLGGGVGIAAAEPLALRFAPAVNVSNAEGLSDAPAIVTDVDGRVFVAWEERPLELALFVRSDDGGFSFDTPVPVAPGSPYLSFGQIELASLGANDVRAAFTAFDLFYGAAEVVYAGSINGGASFSEPVLLSPIDSFNSYAPDAAARWGVAVAWSDFDVWTGVTAIRLRISTDGGATFSEQKRVDDSFGYACCPAVALSGDSTIFVAWQEKIDPFAFDEAYEVLFARSLDGGATFSAPINLSGMPEPSYPPRMATDASGVLYVMWEEGDYLEDMSLYLTVSADGGATFEAPQRLAGPAGDIRGDLAVSSDGVFWAAWVERDGFGGYTGRITRSLDAGATFATPAVMPGDCGAHPTCAYVLAADSRSTVFIAEGPAGQGTEEVFVTRGDASTCGDANDDGAITATDALLALSAAVGLGDCDPVRCDTDASGAVTASDALAILNAAVGIAVVLSCP